MLEKPTKNLQLKSDGIDALSPITISKQKDKDINPNWKDFPAGNEPEAEEIILIKFYLEAISDFVDGLIYVFIHKPVRWMLMKKLNETRRMTSQRNKQNKDDVDVKVQLDVLRGSTARLDDIHPNLTGKRSRSI